MALLIIPPAALSAAPLAILKMVVPSVASKISLFDYFVGEACG
jgi:hypothetical protein